MATHGQRGRIVRTRWMGWVVFGSVLLLISGVINIVNGVMSLQETGMGSWAPIGADTRSAGWSLLALGIILIATAAGLLVGQMWARVVGIIFAVLSILANIAFLTLYPTWSIVAIVLDVIVIYAIAAHGRELKRRIT